MRNSKYFPIYPNQRQAAQNVINSFRQGIRYAVVTAETQSGKTGTCQAICYLIRDAIELGIENIYFICGMNDNNLKKQQVREFEGLIKENQVLFSKDMQFFGARQRKLKKKQASNTFSPDNYLKNTLIFCDESHYAQNKGSMVHKFMTDFAGLTMDGDVSKWIGQNLYCVSISATPMSEMVDIIGHNHPNTEKTLDPDDPDYDPDLDPDQDETILYNGGDILNVQKQYKVMVRLEPGANYYGFRRMFECGKVFKSKNFGDAQDRQDFHGVLHKLWLSQKSENQYKYAIIRFSNSGHGDQYRQSMIGLIDFPVKYIHFHSETMDIREINKILKTPPEQFTIIEVYHSLRAGIQMNTENICLVHETLSAHTDSTVQGLPGRCTGYNKEKDGVLVYCNMKALEKYVKLVDADFDPTYTPGNSANIKKGFTKKTDQLFESNVPKGAILNPELLANLKELKNSYAQYSNRFESQYLNEVLNTLEFPTNEQTSCFVGVTILDANNRTNTTTSTWAKFWDPAYKAYTKGTKGSYFRNIELPPGYRTYYYVYVNIKPGHDQYGWALVTSKKKCDPKKGTYLQTSGKEQFHPNNNVNLVEKELERLFKKPEDPKEKIPLTITFKKSSTKLPLISFKKPLSELSSTNPDQTDPDNYIKIAKPLQLTFRIK
jgi:hypothetical protein